jgi:DnaJ-class molecular chaperone
MRQAGRILRAPDPEGTGEEVPSGLTKALDHLLVPLDGSTPAPAEDPESGEAGRGDGEFDEASWDPQKLVTRGENVHLAIMLRAFEVQTGARPVIRFTVVEMCLHCGGRGLRRMPDPNCETCIGTGRPREHSSGEAGQRLPWEGCPECGGAPCANCEGTGGVRADRRLRLLVPPGLSDGSQLRIAGEGSVPEGIGVPGDVLVDVRVLPEASHSRVWRYVALAMFVIALVLLAYMLRH